MKKQLWALLVEDSELDALLIIRELKSGGYDLVMERVETEQTFLAALESKPWDLILCDYRMPDFNGLTALQLFKKRNLDIPFIMVSAVMTEDLIVEAMRAGAHDYVMKAHLNRLNPAVERELHEAEVRRESVRTAQALRESEMRYRSLFENMIDGYAYCKMDFEGTKPKDFLYIDVNGRFEELTGLKNVAGKKVSEVIPGLRASNPELFESYGRVALTGKPEKLEAYVEPLRIWLSISVYSPGREYFVSVFENITERKKAEEAGLLLTTALESTANGVAITDLKGNIVWVNNAFTVMTGYASMDVLGRNPKILNSGKQEDSFYRHLWETILAGDVWHGELVNKKKDGSLYNEEMTITPLKHTNGGITNFIAIKQDVTERKRAAGELKQRKEFLEAIMESSMDVILTVTNDGKLAFSNSKITSVLGYTYEEIKDRPLRDFVPEEYRAELSKLWEKLLHGAAGTQELQIIRNDGTLADCIVSYSPVEGFEENLILVKDITARKIAEQQNRTLAHAVKSIGECVCITDLDDTVLFVNEAFLKTYGYEEREVLGKNIEIVRSHDNKAELVRGILPSTIDGSWQGEIMNRRKDGSEFPVSLSTSAVTNDEGKIIALIGVATDITERTRAEQALMASEVRYRRLFESAQDGILILDAETGMIVDVNPFLIELLGYSHEQFLGKEIWDLGFFKNIVANKVRFMELQQTGYVRYADLPLETVGGKKISVEFVSNVYHVGHKKVIQCNIRNITERKQAESEIQKNRELLNSIFATSRDGIVLEDDLGMIMFVNSAYVKLFGYALENELVGKHVSIVRAPEDNERLLEYSRRRLVGQDAPSIYEYKGRCKDGSFVDLEVSVAATEIGGKKHILSVVRDIRDRKKEQAERHLLEERTRQAQKMEAIGTLAGGIAHDFNNILAIILGHISIVKRSGQDEAVRRASAETISQAVQRGANLVRQILTFARKTDVTLVPVNVNASVKEIRKMLVQTFPKSIEFAMELEKELPLVIIDADELHQALLNLCVNARDAVVDARNNGGVQPKITLKTSLASGKELRERFPEVSADQYVAVSVTDTGMGMDETMRKRIFEPFFTTKEMGKGTGLGLAIVYGVARSAHGIVDVQSAQGRGSVFTLYLPVPKEASVSGPKHEKRHTHIPGGTETLLIVEDEESLLAILQTSLQNKGYRIIPAVDGREALKLFKQQQDHIHMVITDLGLPKLSGEAVVRELKNIKPGIKVIVASGYVDREQKLELFALGAKEIIMKPYDQTEVLEKVRSVLDAP